MTSAGAKTRPTPVFTPSPPPLDIAATQGELNALANRTNVIEQRLDEHTEALEPLIGLDEVGLTRITNLEIRMDRVESPQNLAPIYTRLEHLESHEHHEAIYDRLARLEDPEWLAPTNERIDQLDERLSDRIEQLTARVNSLEERVLLLENPGMRRAGAPERG